MKVTAASAYSLTGGAWQRGPGRIYDRLAEVVVEQSPVPVSGAVALDVGAGTGAASRALLGAGAGRVVAVDVALGMLTHDASARPPAVVGEILALPFADACADVVVAAFSLNHVDDSAEGLLELVRVTRRGGGVVASAYADDDTHPVKDAVEEVLGERGWRIEPWYEVIRTSAAPALGSVDAARSVASAAGVDAEVYRLAVPFPQLGAEDLVEWRLGLAQYASFISALSNEERREVAEAVLHGLRDDWPPLERTVIVLRAVRG